MNAEELWKDLTAQRVEFWTEGNRLRYRAPKEVLTPALLEQLRRHKHELMQLVAGTRAPTVPDQCAGQCVSRFPLSRGQQALWFLYQSDPKSAAYNVASAATIRSVIDVPALRRSFQKLVDRHASLRGTFTMCDGQPVQEVHESQSAFFEQIDAASWARDVLSRRVFESYQRPFDLKHGPVARLSLFTRSADHHVLLLTIHHIACDAWSVSLLQEELRQVYPREKRGEPVELPPLQATYADYVRWHDQMLAGPAGERLWEYWRQQLSGELPVINLATDRPRPPVQTFRGTSLEFDLPASLVPRLRQLARQEGATLYMTLLAAYQVLLHRYTGREDLLVAGPTAGRTQPQLAGVVGYFINPVVLRADLSGNPPFRDFLHQARKTSLAALAHQDFPFSLIVERLKIKRDPSRSPLFQVVFLYQKPEQFDEASGMMAAGLAGVAWGGFVLEPFDMPQQEGQFDLTLEIIETSALIRGVFKYNTDLFEADTVARMRDHYLNLVEAIVSDPGKRVGELAMLGEAERAELLVNANAATLDFPADACVQQMFETQVGRTPDAAAVVFDDRQLTYRELNERANQLAHFLRSAGLGPDRLAAISVNRSLEMVVGILGILKAGGVYLPLDPAYPQERRRFMLEDSRVVVLLAGTATEETPVGSGTRVVRLDTDIELIRAQSRANPDCTTSPDNLAYVIYTSGSTGLPKAVAVEHQGLCHLAVALRDAFFVGSGDRVLQFASLSFDASVEEMFSALVVGATLVVARQEDLLPGPGLAETLRRQAINVATLPPSALAVTPAENLPDLHTVITAGEACSAEVARRWGDGRRLVNGYGPTEDTVCATSALWDGTTPRPHIGRPLPGKSVYVLDGRLQPVPVGVPGELYLGGIGLARAYLNRPGLTAERFVPDAFSGVAGARLYKTGDLCAWRRDGNLEFLGRIDHQVKVRAFRIELGEIESALAAHPNVRQSVVLAREDSPGDQRLVAYLVAESARRPSATELRALLQESLPEYMIPAAFVFLDEMPLLPNRKVDRKALPVPERIRPTLESPYVAPRSPAEKALAEIWSDVLSVDKVGIHDNYFELGGASISSLRIIARAADAGLSIDPELLRPELLFEHPTIAQLAALIGSAEATRIDAAGRREE